MNPSIAAKEQQCGVNLGEVAAVAAAGPVERLGEGGNHQAEEELKAQARAWLREGNQRAASICDAWQGRSELDRIEREQAASEGTRPGETGGLSTPHISTGAKKRVGKMVREGWSGVRFAEGGAVAQVKFPKLHRMGQRQAGGKRGKVCRFSRDSRRRFIFKLASVPRKKIPAELLLFLTLTQPGSGGSGDPAQWRRQVERFRKCLERQWGKLPVFWRREFQKRKSGEAEGRIVPHLHLLMVATPEILADLDAFRAWCSYIWFRCVGSGEETHLKAGTNVQRVRSWNGAMSYTSKYLGKLDDCHPVDRETGEVLPCGRLWGVWNEAGWGVSWKWVGAELEKLVQLRRWLCRATGQRRGGLLRSRGYLVTCETVERMLNALQEQVTARGSYLALGR